MSGLPSLSLFLPDATATAAAGAALAEPLARLPQLVFLEGDLGAGKTTLVRGLLRALGVVGAVRSPTYSLLEPYEVQRELRTLRVQHVDLYRLGDPEELEYLGLRDAFEGGVLTLIEWPERGGGWLPAPDLVINIKPMESGRELFLQAGSEQGGEVVSALRVAS